MKKLRLLVLLMGVLILLSGCSTTKETVSGETFLAKAKELYLYPSDVSETYGYANEAYYLNNDDGIEILFVVGKRNYDIQGVFLDEVRNVSSETGALFGDVETTESSNDVSINEIIPTTTTNELVTSSYKSGKNWMYVTVSNSSNYYYVAYVDNTYLYIKADKSNESKMKKLIDAIGY